MGQRPDFAVRSTALTSRRQHSRGSAVFVVIGTAWVVGLFGLERGRPSFQLPLIALAGFVAYGVLAALRRHRIEARERTLPRLSSAPPPCVVVRKFGEDVDQARSDHPAGSARRAPDLRLVLGEKPSAGAARRRAAPRSRSDYIPLTSI